MESTFQRMQCSFSRFALLFWFGAMIIGAQELTDPTSILSSNGVLQVNLTLELTTHTIGNSDIELTTRFFNGMFPGPTLRMHPGDELRVNFTNALVDQGIPFVDNELSGPDETNIHFHGLHVSGELPSDDTTHVVRPGESFAYFTLLPNDHMPGTHWLHPHRHGSSSLQVGGGAALALIVEDAPGALPPWVENATEIILFLAHQMDLQQLQSAASQSSDNSLFISKTNLDAFVAVNGQLNPVISLTPGAWVRFRVIWAAWLRGSLDFSIPNCEMQLLWPKTECISATFRVRLIPHRLYPLDAQTLW